MEESSVVGARWWVSEQVKASEGSAGRPLLLGWWEVVAVARDSRLRCRTVARGYVIHASSVQISQLLESLLLSRHPAWPGRAALIEPRTL